MLPKPDPSDVSVQSERETEARFSTPWKYLGTGGYYIYILLLLGLSNNYSF